MSIKKEIVKYIRQNRVSTTEVADCLGKSGLFEGAKALNRGHFCVGPVRWIYGYGESNYTIHEQARFAEEGEVILIECFDCGDRAAFGELVTKFLLLYRSCEAVVSSAPMRDAHSLIKNNFAVWCPYVTPIGTFNAKPDYEMDPEIIKQRRALYDGALAVCDDSGVVIIPADKLNEEFLEKLKFMEEQEDIWFDCVDRLKWDTFDTVCLKKYLET